VPRLSIVIPCPGDAECFEATLASVLQNRPDDCEILVVQPRPYDDPYRLSGEVLFLEAPRDCSLVALINTGVRCATGAVVHVLTCDVEVKDGWSDFILSHFRDRSVGSVSPVLLCRDAAGQTATRGVSYGAGGRRREGRGALSSRHADRRQVLGPTLQAGFYRRQAVLEVGGFCEQVGEAFADADMALALRAAGFRAVHENRSLVETRRPAGAPQPSFRHGLRVERLFWRNVGGFDWPRALLWHACLVAGEVLTGVFRPAVWAQLLGRTFAVFAIPSYRRHRRRLRESTMASRAGEGDRADDRLFEPAADVTGTGPAGRAVA